MFYHLYKINIHLRKVTVFFKCFDTSTVTFFDIFMTHHAHDLKCITSHSSKYQWDLPPFSSSTPNKLLHHRTNTKKICSQQPPHENSISVHVQDTNVLISSPSSFCLQHAYIKPWACNMIYADTEYNQTNSIECRFQFYKQTFEQWFEGPFDLLQCIQQKKIWCVIF